MSEGPGIARYLSGSGLDVLASLKSPMTVSEISEATGLSESHVRKILKTEREGNFIRKVDDAYVLNENASPRIQPFLASYMDYLEVSDPRLPNDSEILFRNGEDVVFSSGREQEFMPAGQSAFCRYGMKGMSEHVRYFTTETGEMTIGRVFEEAVKIAEAKDDWRLRLYNELFYIMNQAELSPSPEFLAKHRTVMSGGHIDNWPSRQDIEDRMWMVEE
jgi:predicted transcriptional regulator